jgi:hypothetical protein
MAQAVAGLWHPARLRLPGVDHSTAIAVRGADRAEALARLLALFGQGAAIEWADVAAPLPARDGEVVLPADAGTPC